MILVILRHRLESMPLFVFRWLLNFLISSIFHGWDINLDKFIFITKMWWLNIITKIICNILILSNMGKELNGIILVIWSHGIDESVTANIEEY